MEKYNATEKFNETRRSSSSENNYNRSMDTPVEETGAQMLMIGVEIDNFDDSPYCLIFLNNTIQNEETTVDHRSGTIFPSSTSCENIFSQARGDINQNWVLIDNQSKVHAI